MTLAPDSIGLNASTQTIIDSVSLMLERGMMTVLLGPTLAGKTRLMRLMTGLDQPTAGRRLSDGRDVTGLRVRERSAATVHRQFVNDPSLTVPDSIDPPLRVPRLPKIEIETPVREVGRVRRAAGRSRRRRRRLKRTAVPQPCPHDPPRREGWREPAA